MTPNLPHYHMIHVTNRPPLNSEGGIVQILGKALNDQDAWVSPLDEVTEPTNKLTYHGNLNYTCVTFDRPKKLMDAHYYNISLGLMWPFKHELTDEVESIIAKMAAENGNSATEGLIKNMQGYYQHMKYSSTMLNNAHMKPEVTVAHDFTCAGIKSDEGMNIFTDHTPFPSYEWLEKLFKNNSCFVDSGFYKEYLKTITSYDLVSLHTPEDCQNLIDSLQHMAPDFALVDEGLSIYKAFENEVAIHCVPVGLNEETILQEASEAKFDERIQDHVDKTAHHNVILSVARNDYTKGTMEYADVIDKFFTEFPERKDDTMFLVYRSPSRKGMDSQQDYQELVEGRMTELMEKYPQSLIYDSQGIPHPQLMKLMQLPQITAITSLPTTVEGHDLTVREFVDTNPVNSTKAVMLSENVGARVVLQGGAYMVKDCRDPTIPEKLNHIVTNKDEVASRFNVMKASSSVHTGAHYIAEIEKISQSIQMRKLLQHYRIA